MLCSTTGGCVSIHDDVQHSCIHPKQPTDIDRILTERIQDMEKAIQFLERFETTARKRKRI
jgi:citrate lyase beta subunit